MARLWPDAAAVLALLGLAACADPADIATPAPPVVAPPATVPPPQSPSPPPLTPMTTPQQVVAAMPIGRADPFAPTQQPVAATPPAAVVVPQLPVDLRFTGVIQSRGETQAFVQIGGASGALCLGPQGRCAAGNAEALLLPSGWSVSAIDAANGVLALSFGSERRVLQLSR